MMNITVRMMSIWVGLLLMSLSVATSHNRKQDRVVVQGTDCTQIKKLSPLVSSGIYTIQPLGAKKPFKVYCEMQKDGGWTVIQRRTGGKLSFDKTWDKYKWGFGQVQSDHWLGLNKIFILTKSKHHTSTLRVDLRDFEGGSAFAQYRNFRIGSEKTSYKLHVGEYSGTAGDAISGTYDGISQNGHSFSTSDRDNDGCSPCIFGDIAVNDCSSERGGGWWFSRCGSANLHGDWHSKGQNRGWASGVHWLTWKAPEPYSAKETRMMVKTEQL